MSIIIYVLTGIIAFMLGKSYGYNKCKIDLQHFLKKIKNAKDKGFNKEGEK